MYFVSIEVCGAYLAGAALALAKEVGGRHPDHHPYGREKFEVIRRGSGSPWRVPPQLFIGDFLPAVKAAGELARKNPDQEYYVRSVRSPGFRASARIGFNPDTFLYSLAVSD